MSFDPQPTLHSGDILIRPMRPDDFEPLYAVASDPLIWTQHRARDRHERAVFRDFFDTGLVGGGALVVVDRETGAIIGGTRYHGWQGPESQVEMGWTFFARSRWGDGTNPTVKRLMLNHALATLDRVILHAASENHRSRRAIEKLGARPAGRREDDGGGYSLRFVIAEADRN